jgi:hypothetical protein
VFERAVNHKGVGSRAVSTTERLKHRSGRNYSNAHGSSRGSFVSDHDLDVLVDRRQQVRQAFDREARELFAGESFVNWNNSM